MNLSSELISQFVKITKDEKKPDDGSTVYGTIVEYDGKRCVKLDGSDQITPITSTADVLPGDRVSVLIKNHTATVTGNVTSPSARKESVDDLGEDVKEHGDKLAEFELITADMVTTEQLNAAQANIELLLADKAYIKDLEAVDAEVKRLDAEKATIEQLEVVDGKFETLDAKFLTADAAEIKYATIENLNATNGKFNTLESAFGDFEELTTDKFTAVEADIKNLNADVADIDKLYAKTADIEILYATKAEIDLLEADVADIDTLIFGSASGTTIQTSFANAVIAQLGNAQIKSAMIDGLDASKINAGSINTNHVNVQSEDGRLVISDETIQISDEARVRVQIGKDATGDYSISIWDADGKLMFSEGGITDNAIKDAIIRNDMVSDDANIAASKLNISSLFTEINNSTKTINSSKILMDADNQTLDVAFTQMSTDIDGLTNNVSSQGTTLSVVQGKIDSKVWQEDIKTATDELGIEIDTLTIKQSTFEQTINGINATVSSHTTQIANKADSNTVTEVRDKVSEIETSLDGFKSTVSSTYSTKAEVENIQIGGRNLFKRTGDFDSSIWSVKTTQPYELDSRYMQAVYETQYQDCCACTEKLGFNFADKTKTWTISAMFKGTKDGQMIGVTLDSGRIGWNKQAVPNGSWKKLVWTFQGSSSLSTFRFEANKDDLSVETPIYVAQIKCEHGNKATDWTPAPEDMDDKANSIVSRVEKNETDIKQTNQQISLTATKEEVSKSLSGYYTKTETESKINAKADEINLSVSSTYATKNDIASISIGARNLIRNSQNMIFKDYYFAGGEIVITDDNNGNVTWTSPAVSVYDDGTGNVTVESSAIMTTDDGAGNVAINS